MCEMTGTSICALCENQAHEGECRKQLRENLTLKMYNDKNMLPCPYCLKPTIHANKDDVKL